MENDEGYSEWEFSCTVVGMDCSLSVSYVVWYFLTIQWSLLYSKDTPFHTRNQQKESWGICSMPENNVNSIKKFY